MLEKILLLHIHSYKVRKDKKAHSILADQNESAKQVSDHEINAFYKMGLGDEKQKGRFIKRKIQCAF